MSSFTSKTVRDLYEAYDSIYINQEEVFLNELLEEVTETINSLVDEGWDFSDHTWEEIYESFVDDVLYPELDKINSFFTSLNEEVLNEEEIDSFIQENLGGLLGRLTKLLPGAKKVQQATTAVTKAPKPSILQAPLVKLGVPVTAPPTKPVLQAPIKPIKPTKPLPTAQPEQGGILTQGWKAATDWLSKQGKAPSAATPASASSRSQAARQRLSQRTSTPPPTPPKPPKPPSGQQGWPSIGLRNKTREATRAISNFTSRATTALTPGPKVKGLLKYGALPMATVGLTAAPFVSAANLLSGRPSGLQQASGLAQGATGHIMQGTAGALGVVGSPDAPGMYELGKTFRQAGADTQAEVERKRKSQQGTSPQSQQPRRRNVPPSSLTQTQSFEMSGNAISEEPIFPTTKPKSGDWAKLTIGGTTKIWDPETNSYQLPGTINKRLKSQGEKLITVPGKVPAAKPKDSRLDSPIAGPGPTGNEVGSKPTAPATPAPAAPTPPTAAPATPARPAAAPAAPSRPSSSATASTAEKIKSGMETWRQQKASGDLESATKTGKSVWALANPKLAAAAAERERIRGTSQSDNPLMKDMRSRLPVTLAVQAPAVKDLGPGHQSLSQNKFAGQAPKPKATPTPATSTKTDRPQRARTGFGEAYDAYDLVLEYILSEGHADTLSEAHYVMMQMSSDYIQSIVEQSAIAARTAKVVDDQRQGYYGDTDAINKLQDAASKSMGRLKRGQGPVVTPGLPGV